MNFQEILVLLGELSAAVLVLLAAARPVTLVLRALSALTPWAWDDMFVAHVDRVITFLDKTLRAITGAR